MPGIELPSPTDDAVEDGNAKTADLVEAQGGELPPLEKDQPVTPAQNLESSTTKTSKMSSGNLISKVIIPNNLIFIALF